MPQEKPSAGDTIIFFDVESLPCPEDDPLWLQLLEAMEPDPGETPAELLHRKVQVHRQTALFSTLGRPWMIGYAVGSAEPVVCRSSGDPSEEKELLEEFYEGVKDRGNVWWVGHNIIGYDIPFLQVRALKHGLPGLAKKLAPLRAKPWEVRALDTMLLWPRTGADKGAYRDHRLKGLGKLDTICSVLGVEQQEGTMGPQVYDAFLAGDSASVAEHLRLDIIQVREVFKRLWPLI